MSGKANPEHIESATSTEATAFLPIAPGFYVATVEKMEFSTYRAGWKSIKNPDSKDGKFQYAKLQPVIQLHNEWNSRITRQGFTVGVQNPETGEIYRPDGEEESSAFFAGDNGAFYMLTALNAFDEDGTFDFDPDAVINRVIKVRTAVAGYQKNAKKNYSPKEITDMLSDVNGGSTAIDAGAYTELAKEWDAQFGDESDPLKLKNVIIGFWALDDEQTDEFFVSDEGDVYVSEDDYHAAMTGADDGAGW